MLVTDFDAAPDFVREIYNAGFRSGAWVAAFALYLQFAWGRKYPNRPLPKLTFIEAEVVAARLDELPAPTTDAALEELELIFKGDM